MTENPFVLLEHNADRYKDDEAAFPRFCLDLLHHCDGMSATAIRCEDATELYLQPTSRNRDSMTGKDTSKVDDPFIPVWSTFISTG
jgi:hypothetical protein